MNGAPRCVNIGNWRNIWSLLLLSNSLLWSLLLLGECYIWSRVKLSIAVKLASIRTNPNYILLLESAAFWRGMHIPWWNWSSWHCPPSVNDSGNTHAHARVRAHTQRQRKEAIITSLRQSSYFPNHCISVHILCNYPQNLLQIAILNFSINSHSDTTCCGSCFLVSQP